MRTTHRAPRTPLAMDAMRPSQAFSTPSAPSALDPRRWFGLALALLARVGARIHRPGAPARSPVEGRAS